eukprot:jgi/Hompol1/6678/HPOL_000135-RA
MRTAVCRVSETIKIPMPEMLFGNNSLSVAHRSGVEVVFKAVDALALVDCSPEAADRIKVSYAEHWTKCSADSNGHDKIQLIKPYDWTYTTPYYGSLVHRAEKASAEESQAPSSVVDTDAETVVIPEIRPRFGPTDLTIDIKRLLSPDPILFYNDLILFEDELGDNGIAMLSIRVRVMPSCFLVLQRFFLRVDGVLFRVIDTRLYHEFGSAHLIREIQTREASYESIKQVKDARFILLLNGAGVCRQLDESLQDKADMD